MAQTLLEYAKGAQNTLLAGVVRAFAENSAILRMLPFRTVQGGALQYNVESALPGIGFRNINGAYDESVGVWNPQIEKVKIMGGDMDCDKAMIRRDGPGRRMEDIRAQARAQALAFDKYFFDGDESSEVKQFDGINKRLSGTTQHIYTDHAGSAGAAVDENCIDILIDALDERPDIIVMGKAVYRQVKNIFKSNTLINLQPTEWGFSVPAYDGIPIGIVDKDHQNNVILAMDETVGSDTECGSIYAFKFDEFSGVCGIQSAPPDGTDLGEIDTKPVLRYRLDWDVGFCVLGPRSAVRLAGVKAASGIA